MSDARPRVRSTWTAIVVALALGGLAAASAPARATVMVEVPMERLVAESEAVVHGVVERVGTRAERGREGQLVPHSVAFVQVREWLKGQRSQRRITIDELGGQMPGAAMRITGTPTYATGQEVIVFLRATDEGDFRTYAMAQGHFDVVRGAPGLGDIVVRDTSAIGLARWDQGPMTISHGARRAMRLDDFLGYLRATVEQVEHDTVGGAP